MNFAYRRGGAPLLSWQNGPPHQSRAADSVALGSVLSDPTLSMPLPAPGAPEPLGCGCSGGGSPHRDVIVDVSSPSFLGGMLAGYILYRLLRRTSTP